MIFELDFESNNKLWNLLDIGLTEEKTIRYATQGYNIEVYNPTTGWASQAYRTITFAEPVTNADLLTWLQQNGTKQ